MSKIYEAISPKIDIDTGYLQERLYKALENIVKSQDKAVLDFIIYIIKERGVFWREKMYIHYSPILKQVVLNYTDGAYNRTQVIENKINLIIEHK